MIKIVNLDDLKKIQDTKIVSYLEFLVKHILFEYSDVCSSDNIERFGAIFFIEDEADFDLHEEMGLCSPLTEKRFEYIDVIRENYYNGLIVLDNERCINLIGNKIHFINYWRNKK